MSAEQTLTAKELGVPGLPSGSPTHLEHLIDELTESLDLDAPSTSYRVLKRTFHYLMAYFADIASCLAAVFAEISFGEPSEPDPKNAEETLGKALGFLASSDAPDLPEVKALVAVFYEHGKARKHTQMMGIGGKPRRGFQQLSKLCASTAVPVRKKCVQEVRRYLPFLTSWLQAAEPFFSEATIVRERTSLEGGQQVVTRISNQELVAGRRLELTGCPLCIPERELTVPEKLAGHELHLFVPQKVPRYLLEIIDRLDEAMKADNPVGSCLELRNALEFLIRYFAGISARILDELDSLPLGAAGLISNSKSVLACERLLYSCLGELIKKPDSLAAKSLVSTFYRRNEHFEFVPRWHTQILQLGGALATWCLIEPGYGELESPELCREEFEKFLPTLRDWLLSIGGYLQNTEHFFEEPAEDGSVELSVRIGDRFVELKPPGYVLWINNPRPEMEAAQALPAEGGRKPLVREPLEVPKGSPEVLSRILKRLDLYLRAGDPIEACTSTRDAMDYLTRYFAGLAAAAFRELGTLPEEAARMARSSLSVHECEKLLILSLRSIGRESGEQLGQAVRAVFFYQEEFSEADRPTGAHARMLQIDADPDNKLQNLAEFCSLKEGEGVLANPARSKRELDRFLPVLRDWLATAEPFFAKAQHFEEPPAEDGQTELVVQYQDYYLELVEPDYIFYIRPGSDEIPELEVPSWEELIIPDEPEKKAIPAKLTPEEIAESRPFMKHRVQFIAPRPNSQGKTCTAGYIILTNAGGGTLSGTAVSTHHSIEVEPNRFRGNKVQITYWVDTEELPTSHEAFVLLKTADEERSIPSWEMLPKDKFSTVPVEHATRMLWTVPIVAVLIFLAAFAPLTSWMDAYLSAEVGRAYAQMELLKDAPQARSAVLMAAQAIGWLYLLLPVLTPLAVLKLTKRFPPSTQTLMEPVLRKVMMLPALLILLLLAAPVLRQPLTMDQDLRVMNLLRLYPWFFGFNLLGTVYMELSFMERLDDWFHDPIVRQIVPVVLFVTYLTLIQLGLQS